MNYVGTKAEMNEVKRRIDELDTTIWYPEDEGDCVQDIRVGTGTDWHFYTTMIEKCDEVYIHITLTKDENDILMQGRVEKDEDYADFLVAYKESGQHYRVGFYCLETNEEYHYSNFYVQGPMKIVKENLQGHLTITKVLT